MNRGMTQRTRIRYTRLPARERLWWQSISPFFLIKKTDSKFHISTAIKFQDVTDNCTLNTRDLLLINCVSVTSMGRKFHPKAWTTTWPQNFYQRPGISFFFFFWHQPGISLTPFFLSIWFPTIGSSSFVERWEYAKLECLCNFFWFG